MHTLSAHFCMLKATDETGSAAPNPHDSPQLDSATAMDMGTDCSGGQPDQCIAQKQWATKQQGMRRHNLNVAETRSQRRAKTIADPKNPTRRQINRYTEHQEALRTGHGKSCMCAESYKQIGSIFPSLEKTIPSYLCSYNQCSV